MGKRLDLTGQRFGRLVALKPAPDKNHRTMWKCKCDCGTIKIVASACLQRGTTISCKCYRIELGRKDLTGKRVGKLVVLRYAYTKKSCAYWECQCDCGQRKIVKAECLQKGDTKSCGCLLRKPPGVAAFNSVNKGYKTKAKERGLLFHISKKKFKEITQQECYYCGIKPATRSGNKYSNGDYVYNGIDRVNNNKGYIKNNIVPCCTKCNQMKSTMSQKDFLAHVERIHKHQHNSK